MGDLLQYGGGPFFAANFGPEGDHNLLGGTVFGSRFWSGGLVLAATFGPGGPLLGGDRISRDSPLGVVLSGLQQHTHSFAMSSVEIQLNWICSF